MSFKDKVAIITGAASGIGLLAAQELAKDGAKVVVADIAKEAIETAVKGICENGSDAVGFQVDVRKYEQVKASTDSILEKFGRIDILINCAGGAESRVLNSPKLFHEQPIEVIDWGIDVNLKGAVYFSRAVLGAMIKQESGVIITLGSVTGLEGSDSAIGYSVSKFGMIALARSLALCGAPYGVRACCVSPGPVLTRPGMANMKTRLGRAAEPREVVDLILYLCSEKAAFITGSNYMIDGGRTCGGME